MKIDPLTKMIDHTSGGLSLFDAPDFSFGPDWCVVPAGTELPEGFIVSKDLTNGKFRGHYTIRAIDDIHEETWKRELARWANKHAIHIKEHRKAAGNV